MKHLYGEFTDNQINETVRSLRKSIYFLLICVDPDRQEKIKEECGNVDVDRSFNSLLLKIGGMNHLLKYPPTLVTVMSLLQAAWDEYQNENFEFRTYRKLILDAGSEVLKLEEV